MKIHRLQVQFLVCIIMIVSSGTAGEPSPLLIIRGAGLSFNETVKGLTGELGTDFAVSEFIVTGKTNKEDIARQIAIKSPKMVVLMDNQAIDLFKQYQQQHRNGPAIPSLALMAISVEHAISGMENATGIAYEIPIVTSMVSLRSVLKLPLKRVGIIRRRFLDDFIVKNQSFCTQEGFELVQYVLPDSVRITPAVINGGLTNLLKDQKVDAIWIPNDNAVLTPENINDAWIPNLALYKKPVVVGVEVLVKPEINFGTFAVLPDHAALGQQAVQMILDIRDNGWNTGGAAVQPPLSVIKVLNGTQAQRLFGIVPAGATEVDRVLTVSDTGEASLTVQALPNRQNTFSLGSLLDMQVTSVSKKAERMMDVPTSIYVITGEDIRRSGATRITDLLNMVPGYWATNNTYNFVSGTVRNINEITSMTVNVLIDGVQIITPVLGGTVYNCENYPLDNIERIEVIKGSGGTIYGANSATGVVNIITKNAEQGQGCYVKTQAGGDGFAQAEARYGTRLGPSTAVSVYALTRMAHGFSPNTDFVGDSVDVLDEDGNSFRIKNKFSSKDEGRTYSFCGGVNSLSQLPRGLKLTLNSCYQLENIWQYSTIVQPFPATGIASIDSVVFSNNRNSNVALSARLDIPFASNHNLFILGDHFRQIDYYFPVIGSGTINPKYSNYDFEVQDSKRFFAGQPVEFELLSGLNWRTVVFDIQQSYGAMFNKPRDMEYMGAGYLQGKLTFSKKVDLVLGDKAEFWTLISKTPEEAWNKYKSEGKGLTQFLENYPSYSPNVRLAYHLGEKTTAWSAWSQSVSVPAYIHTNIEQKRYALPPSANLLTWQDNSLWRMLGLTPDADHTPPSIAGKWVSIVATENLQPTVYHTTEAGFRTQTFNNLVFDVSVFYSIFTGSITDYPPDFLHPIPSRISPGDTIIPIYFGNLMDGHSYGGEAIARWNIRPGIKSEFSYSYLIKLTTSGISNSTKLRSITEPFVPYHIIRARFYLDLPYNFSGTINSAWYTDYDNAYPFNYQEQRFDPNFPGLSKETHAPYLQLDLKIEKKFLNNRFTAFLWGRDLFADQKIEAYYWYITAYPHTVSRSFGAGVSYNF